MPAGPAQRAPARARDVLGTLPLWPSLVVLSAVVLAVQLPGRHATAWHYFHDASRLLLGDAPAGEATGLHLYGDHPQFQFGPLSILVSLPFMPLGHTVGSWVAMVAMSALGVVTFALLLDAARRLRPDLVGPGSAPTVLAAGAVAVVTWGDVAVRTAHIDDALVLAAVAMGLRAVAAGRSWTAAIALGAAAAAKPWGALFAPLVLVAPGRLRQRAAWSAVLVAVPLLTWAPFVLAEPATLDTADFAIANDSTSVLRALGVEDPTTPSWVRPAQLVGGVLVVGAVVALRRWPAALLAGVAWRLLLDPAANRYYTIGFVLGAALLELVLRPGRIPWATVAAAVVLEATALAAPPDWFRWPRFACVAAGLAVAFAARPPVHRPHPAGVRAARPGARLPTWTTRTSRRRSRSTAAPR